MLHLARHGDMMQRPVENEGGSPAETREYSVDIARGLAIFAVLAYHFEWAPPASNFGLYGVLLFFFISGYCMEISLSASSSAIEFAARRLSRLVPALLVCALTTHLIETALPLRPDRMQHWFDVAKTVLCIPLVDIPCQAAQIILGRFGAYTMVDGAYWSLQVEFKFYALLLFTYFFVSKRWHLTIFLIISAIAGIYQTYATPSMYLRNFIPYMPCFAAGMAMYEIRHRGQLYGAVGLTSACGLAVVFAHVGIDGYSLPTNLPAFFICCATLGALSFITLSRNARNGVAVRPVLFLAAISYPLYLLHTDIGYVLNSAFGAGLLPHMIMIGALVGVAWIVHKTIEFRIEHMVKAMRSVRRPGITTVRV